MQMQVVERRFETGEVSLNYAEVTNDKPPMVLLHGGSAQWDSVSVLMEAYSAEFHIYAPELRGHGKSGWVANSYTLQHYTDDVVAFLRQVVGQPAVIFGHSLGGIVGLMIAAQSPDNVRALIVGDAPLSAASWVDILRQHRDKIVPWRDMAGGAYSAEEIAEKLGNEWVAHNLICLDPDTHTILIDDPERAAAGFDMVLPNVRCPVLLLQGDPATGGLMTDAEVAEAIRLLAQPVYLRLEGVSHILQNEQPKVVIAAMSTFLSNYQLS